MRSESSSCVIEFENKEKAYFSKDYKIKIVVKITGVSNQNWCK